MSLGGLSLAAGMLVDNSIVVLENISRHLTGSVYATHDTPPEANLDDIDHRRAVAAASEKGTREVTNAVLAATFTTIAVFFPVVYVPGIAGAFFRDQALAVVISLLVSVVVALLLQPMLCSRLLGKSQGPPHAVFRRSRDTFIAFTNLYHKWEVSALRHPVLLLVILLAGLAGTGVLGVRLGRSLLPERSAGDMRIDVELPTGTPLEETVAWTEEFAGWLSSDTDVKTVFSQVGRTERTLESLSEYTGPHTSRIRVILKTGRGGREKGLRLQGAAEERLKDTPGVAYAFGEEGIGLGEVLEVNQAPFSVGIVAEEPLTAVRVAEELTERLSAEENLRGLSVDRVIGTPNIVVRLDAQEIHRSGLDPDHLTRELRNRIRGVEATTFNEVDQRIDISVRIPRDQRRDLSQALDSPVETPSGESVPLRSYVHVTEERPFRELTRQNQRRMVTISAELQGASADDMWRKALAVTDEMDLPPGVQIVQSGGRMEMVQSFKDLLWALLLAALLVYMILAAQFESFVDPLIVASSIPIGVAGSILAMAATGTTVNILSLIGVVVILGIAVNDDILKVDTIRRLRAEGMEDYQAILEAGRLRVRPILMTSVTTILGSLPMAIGIGSGEQLQRPLALTIIGGLILSTSMTLIFTPILYMIAHRIRRPNG